MAGNSISEHLFLKIFSANMPPDPPKETLKTRIHPWLDIRLTVIRYITHIEYFRNNLTTEIREIFYFGFRHNNSELAKSPFGKVDFALAYNVTEKTTETGKLDFENWMKAIK